MTGQPEDQRHLPPPRWLASIPEPDFRPEPIAYPKVTAVELIVHTADGKVARYDFNGHPGHHIEVELEQRPERVDDPLRWDGPPVYTQHPTIVATITARGGVGPGPLLVMSTGEPT